MQSTLRDLDLDLSMGDILNIPPIFIPLSLLIYSDAMPIYAFSPISFLNCPKSSDQTGRPSSLRAKSFTTSIPWRSSFMCVSLVVPSRTVVPSRPSTSAYNATGGSTFVLVASFCTGALFSRWGFPESVQKVWNTMPLSRQNARRSLSQRVAG